MCRFFCVNQHGKPLIRLLVACWSGIAEPHLEGCERSFYYDSNKSSLLSPGISPKSLIKRIYRSTATSTRMESGDSSSLATWN